MSVNPSHLRPGNWIHRKGSSRYGIVNGDLLALLEKDEKLREGFEYVELTGELLEAAGFRNGIKTLSNGWILGYDYENKMLFLQVFVQSGNGLVEDIMDLRTNQLHRLQQFYELFTGSELPLPESAKIIPELSPNNP